MKTKPNCGFWIGAIRKYFYIPVILLMLISCGPINLDSLVDGSQASESGTLMQVSFESETVRFSQLAEHMDASGLSEDARQYVATRAVPLVKREKQTFTIYRDGRYQLIIDILNPASNPAREAFREETSMNDWELQKMVITNQAIIGYDGNGEIILSEDNSQNVYFNRLVDKITSNPYFASHVNIGNALFRISAGAENYLDPKLRGFFLSEDTGLSYQDGFLMVKQNMGATLFLWGDDQVRQGATLRTSGLAGDTEPDEDVSHTPEETMDMMQETTDNILNQRNAEAVYIITAIDSTNAEIAAEVIYAGDEQILAMTAYEVADDEQKTIASQYTETFESDPVYDLDLLNIESVTYSDVEIVNNTEG